MLGAFGIAGRCGILYVYNLPCAICPATDFVPKSWTLIGGFGGVNAGAAPGIEGMFGACPDGKIWAV